MFNFFNIFSKTVDINNIRNLEDALNASKFYIRKKEWNNAHKLIEITKIKEKELTERQIEHLDKKGGNYEAEKTKILKLYNRKLQKILDIEAYLTLNENKFRFIPESIKKYDDAIRSIKTLIYLSEWKKAKEAIEEIKTTEKKGLDKLFKKLDTQGNELNIEGEKKKQLKIYKKKETKLEKILADINKKERKYIEKRNIEKFKIRFKKIKSEIELLTKTGKSQQALNLLKLFLSENKENTIVIKFYNSEKTKILKSLESNKKKAEEKLNKNVKAEAMKLAGQTLKIANESNEKKIELGFFDKIKKKLNFYKSIQDKLRKKRLLDDITLLLEENSNINNEIAKNKLSKIHKGLIKEISATEMDGYDLFGKILGADKITGDTFGFNAKKEKYNFFLGDATGHGIKAGLIISLFTRLFTKYVGKKNIQELAFEINNGLKQDLESRNFITGIFFEIERENIETVKFVGMGHEPMLIYRKKTNEVERIIPGGLAAGIRNIKKVEDVIVKKIKLEDGDIILIYSDGILESKNPKGEFFGISKLEESFKKIAKIENKSYKIYSYLIDTLTLFRGGSAFDDDATIMLLLRDPERDILKKDSMYIRGITSKEGLNEKDNKRLEGKNKTEILAEIQKIKKEKQEQLIIGNLKRLYQIGEFLKLKQDAIRYIKEGYVHKDINFYLKKALDNETKYKIGLKNKKIDNRYNVMLQLYKNGDYDTVIREIEDVISKDGAI